MIRFPALVPMVMVLVLQSASADTPDPSELLRRVEFARLQTPASRLRMVTEFGNNKYEFDAEFNAENRRFWVRSTNRNKERMTLSGTIVTHFDGTESVTIRDVKDQNSSLFFDPRLLGITTTYWWRETLEGNLPYRDGTNLRTIGLEEIDGKECWHVSVVDTYKQRKDLWIDSENENRVYRYDFSIPGFKRNSTTSVYVNDTQRLPSRVVTNYYDASGNAKSPPRILIVLEADSNVEFPDTTWGYESLELPIGTPVTDIRAKRGLGYWNGSGLSLNRPSIGKQRE